MNRIFIIDNGADFVKAGIHGESSPLFLFSIIFFRRLYRNAIASRKQNNFIGNEIDELIDTCDLNIKRPFHKVYYLIFDIFIIILYIIYIIIHIYILLMFFYN